MNEQPTSISRKRSKLGFGSKDESGDHQETPKDLYDELNKEFAFEFDPCPLHGEKLFDGLNVDWKKSNFVNPPWSNIQRWVIKAREEAIRGNKTVMLIPARTNSAYWHDFILSSCSEIRFIRGRLAFGEHVKTIRLTRCRYAKDNKGAPIPVCIVVFEPTELGKVSNKKLVGRYVTSVWQRKQV